MYNPNWYLVCHSSALLGFLAAVLVPGKKHPEIYASQRTPTAHYFRAEHPTLPASDSFIAVLTSALHPYQARPRNFCPNDKTIC